jgi:hypothetical protein
VIGLEGVATVPTAIGHSCPACLTGKMSVKPHPKHSASRTTKPLQLVHSDVVGPMRNASLSGARYYVVFIDDFSRYCWVAPLKHKSGVLNAFRAFKSKAEQQVGGNSKVGCLRSDNGGEYASAEMADFLMLCGVAHQFTAPHSPEQNGVAERSNRTLFESARAMMQHAGLSASFWAAAIGAAAYVKNRLPHKAVRDHGTPVQALLGVKPDITGLRVFGCLAHVHVPDSQRTKLDAKARLAIFVGYAENTKDGYYFCDPLTKRVTVSRTAAFHESQFDVNDAPPAPLSVLTLEVPLPTSGTTGRSAVAAEPPGQADAGARALPTDEPFENDEVQEVHEVDIAPDFGDDEDAVVDNHDEQPVDPVRAPVAAPLAPSRHSVRERRPIQRLGRHMPFGGHVTVEGERPMERHLAFSSVATPATVTEALKDPDWVAAIDKEMDSMIKNEVFDLVELPRGRKAIGSKVIFKVKTDSTGSVSKLKARFVAQGFRQVQGLDYNETFAPTAKGASIRAVLALAADADLELDQMDVATAFLNGNLEEEIYMRQPEGTIRPGDEHLVWRLKRSIYGLKQSSRAWYKELDAFLRSIGFKCCESDASVYVQLFDDGIVIVVVYVDDLLIAASRHLLQGIKDKLSGRFEMTDLGHANWLLGMEIKRDRVQRTVSLGQAAFAKDILERFNMSDCNPADTPMSLEKLSSDMSPASKEEEEHMAMVPYRSAVGSMMYLMICSRPDLATAIGILSQYMASPGPQHWTAAKRVLRYIAGTVDKVLVLGGRPKGGLVLTGYADADWAGDIDRRRSTSGFCFSLGRGCITWSSKRQSAVALSTLEAEYISIGTAVREVLWLRAFLAELHHPQETATVIKEDNQGCIARIKNPGQHSRTKHIDIVHHFVRDIYESGIIDVEYCRTDAMVADILTKPLTKDKHDDFVAQLDLCHQSFNLRVYSLRGSVGGQLTHTHELHHYR